MAKTWWERSRGSGRRGEGTRPGRRPAGRRRGRLWPLSSRTSTRGADGPGAEVGGRDVGADPGLGTLRGGRRRGGRGDEIARADGERFRPGRGRRAYLHFGELRGELGGGFGLGLLPERGVAWASSSGAGAEAGDGGGFFGLRACCSAASSSSGGVPASRRLDPARGGRGRGH
jgi:hypothetical protein